MSVIYAVIMIFFIIFNLIVYHKIFDVYYFDLQKGCGTELIGAFFVAIIETGLLVYIGAYLLIGIGIILAIALVVKVIKKYTNKIGTDSGEISYVNVNNATDKKEYTNNSGGVEQQEKTYDAQTVKKEAQEAPIRVNKKDERMFCPYCGKKILRTSKFCNFCGESNSYKG